MPMIIFTDLDGSLLDHDDYSFQGALPALARIRESGIPLVIVTSKTRTEVEALLEEMGLEVPFVVESGGGLFFPPRFDHLPLPDAVQEGRFRVVRLGVPYQRIRDFLASLPPALELRGFGDLSPEAIQEATGLTEREARMARVREFTEPFLPGGPGGPGGEARMADLQERAARAGLKIVQGGRFHHLMGVEQDKGRAVLRVARAFREGWGSEVRTVGLGDSPNDLAMLEVVDIPILIPNPRGSPPALHRSGLVKAPLPGSRGWNAAVLDLLDSAKED
ncbi:MAG: HAD-IIB family hydrolase [Gemmatimonadota bacterium]